MMKFVLSATKNDFSHFTIVKDKNGNVIKMIMQGEGGDEEALKISDKPATDKK